VFLTSSRVKESLRQTAGGYGPPSPADVLRYETASRLLPCGWILDDGCGTGALTTRLCAKTRSVVGVDPALLRLPRRRFSQGSTDLALMLKQSEVLPFRTGVFQGAVSLEVIEHLRGQAQYLDELARVVSIGGTLVLSTPNRRVIEPYYSEGLSPLNITHIGELYPADLARLLAPRFSVDEVYAVHARDLEGRRRALLYQLNFPIPYRIRARVPLLVKVAWTRLRGNQSPAEWVVDSIDWPQLEDSVDLRYEDLLLKCTRRQPGATAI
jgi:SAM-dependent methyltransferase